MVYHVEYDLEELKKIQEDFKLKEAKQKNEENTQGEQDRKVIKKERELSELSIEELMQHVAEMKSISNLLLCYNRKQ